MRTLMEATLARHTGKDADVIRKDTDRDKILTAPRPRTTGSSTPSWSTASSAQTA